MKALTVGVCLLALMAVVFGVYEARESARAAAATRAGEARRDDLRLRVRAREAADAAERRRQADLASALAAANAQAAASAGARGLSSSDKRAAYFNSHPRAKEQFLKNFQASLPTTWNLLAQYLHLTPQQQAGLMDLLEQREENDLRLAAEEQGRGLAADSPEIQALDDQLDSANKAQIKALLGAQDYRTFHEFFHDEEVLPMVSDLAQNLAGTTTPLSPDTAVAITRVLAQSSATTSTGAVIEDTVDWTKANAAAAKVLGPEQYAAYELVAQRAQTTQQINQMEKAIAPGL